MRLTSESSSVAVPKPGPPSQAPSPKTVMMMGTRASAQLRPEDIMTGEVAWIVPRLTSLN